MIKNDGNFLDGSRLENIQEWPRFETANNVSWLNYCSCMTRDPSCDLHLKRKVYGVGTPAIAPLECKVSSHGQVSQSRVASELLPLKTQLALRQCTMRSRQDMLYMPVLVGNVELSDDLIIHSGQARRAPLSLRIVLARANQGLRGQPLEVILEHFGARVNQWLPDAEAPLRVPRLSGPSLVLSAYQTHKRVYQVVVPWVTTRQTRIPQIKLGMVYIRAVSVSPHHIVVTIWRIVT